MIVSIDGSTDGSEEMVAGFEAPYALRFTAGPGARPRRRLQRRRSSSPAARY